MMIDEDHNNNSRMVLQKEGNCTIGRDNCDDNDDYTDNRYAMGIKRS